MTEASHFKFSNSVLFVPLGAMITIWVVYWCEVLLGVNYNDYGVLPRTLSGLRGILLSPFIHGSLTHLYNNTIPLGVLLTALFYFYRNVAWQILLLGILLSGTITWCIGRESYHIGASGLIYVLASFMFFKGVFSKYYRLIALSLVVVFIYGSLLWYIFPVKDGISWEGHLAGFITGLLFALFVKVKLPVVQKYAWEKEDFVEDEDPFLKHFDEQGNFIETPFEESTTGENEEPVSYIYHIKKDQENT